jgi:hypothetical protein
MHRMTTAIGFTILYINYNHLMPRKRVTKDAKAVG